MSDHPLARTAYEENDTPRRWYLRVCPCGVITAAGTACAGFPGAWSEELCDFNRSACLGEIIEVEEVSKS